ncbi:hypothetical protein GPECTOR_4g622 [Gonium pectorale]|uniref:U1-type domain-containing protein n=1 Tax=Gonium pectorale TaxID=33097 RepID=A0A150GXE2_GONPE|nr:hypothetical protein GPECTOR_4g622 [Gonium pectorale]|eukprot:KXZ54557.1 hypothetical protein GPECTOR_4g622 [Gonium pectorale]
MTEYWKSNAMHWCDICKCWMNDTKQAKLNHERGAQHQAKLANKLRDMARKAENDAKAKSFNDEAVSRAEAAAKKAYAADLKAAEAAAGSWEWDEGSSYYYNATHRWYYDPKTQWYYGGEPTPEWSQEPPIPAAARFGVAQHAGGPVPQGQGQQGAGGAAAAGSEGGAGAGKEGLPFVTKKVQRVVAIPKHPLAALGGHQAPTTGKVGGGMGAGVVLESGEADVGAKRKREDGKGGAGGGGKGAKGAMSKEEEEALARREAARQRVAQRTAAGFGYV